MMPIRYPLINADNNYWELVTVVINGNITLLIPNGIVHNLIPRPTMEINDLYNYEFSFDGNIPEESNIRECMLNLFWGSMYENSDVSFLDDLELPSIALLSLFRFIDQYVFPKEEELVEYVNRILYAIVKDVNEYYDTIFKAHEMLYYGIRHLRPRYNGEASRRYYNAGQLLLKSLEIDHLFSNGLSNDTSKRRLNTIIFYESFTEDSILCKNNFKGSDDVERTNCTIYGLIRKIYSADPSKLPIDDGIHFRYYMSAFNCGILKESLDQVDFSVETFMKLVARQYTDIKKIIISNNKDMSSLFNMYTHWCRNSCEENKNIIEKELNELVDKYNKNWDKMMMQLIPQKFLKTLE